MKSLSILFIVVLILVIGSMAYYYYFVKRMKEENSLLGNRINQLTANYKAEGLDKYYEGLVTMELIKEHKKIVDACNRYQDELDKLAELSCKENFILAVLGARGVDTEELVRKHLGMETQYKNSFDHNVRIVSIKVSLLFTLVFFEITLCGAAALFLKGMDDIAQMNHWSIELLVDKDFLLMLFMLIISICGTYAIFAVIKASTYIVKLENKEFTYKFITQKIIPYSEIEKLQYIRTSYRGSERHVLCIKLKDRKTINLRLDHLYFYKSAEVIRPRDTRYLGGSGDEDLMLEFFSRKTGKPVEVKTQTFYHAY